MFDFEQSLLMLLNLIGINIIAFFLMGLDKRYAINHHYRISESFLLSVALFGGALGIWIGMRWFHHKTRKPLFMLGAPILLGLNVIILFKVFLS